MMEYHTLDTQFDVHSEIGWTLPVSPGRPSYIGSADGDDPCVLPTGPSFPNLPLGTFYTAV